tara:strand:+ start:84271 stop:85107 length:837 start_codon:yes stop_codon:yes gene_type:complete
MKKILVPTDFSKYSENALQVAANIAKQINAEILIFHMMGLSPSGLNTNSSQSATEAIFHLKIAEKGFKDFLNKAYLKGIKVKELVQNYTNFNELNNVALENNIDLIVMGSHGTSGLVEEVFVGSNTEKVVRTSEVPVLVIKDEITDFKIKKVVFACDFRSESTQAYLNAMRLFDLFKADVYLVYVNLPHQFNSTNQMEAKVKAFLFKADAGDMKNFDNVIYLSDYTVESGVHNYCKTINADLIAIPTHGRKGLAHFFNGSIGEDITNHEKRPVLTFKI